MSVKARQTVQCSNCMTPLVLKSSAMTIEVTIPAAGRGSKRTPARTVVNEVVDEGALWAWEAPCCPDYWDSLEFPDPL